MGHFRLSEKSRWKRICEGDRQISEYTKKEIRRNLEFRIKGELIHVKLEDIVYFEKYKHQVYVHLADQTVLTVRENMQDFEKELAGKGFVRNTCGIYGCAQVLPEI